MSTPPTTPQLAAIVLAAGLSSRMGQLKPALPLGASTVLGTALLALQEAGLKDIIVVTGREPGIVAALAYDAGARTVHNPDFETGMFSSVRTGVTALPAETDAFFLLPADIPLVRSATIRLMAEAFANSQPDWAVPCFQGQRGHPPLIDARLCPTILAHDGTGGLRTVLESPLLTALEVAVPDVAVLMDMDIPEDYQRAQALAKRRHVPTRAEIEALWDIAKTPSKTRDHCRAVGLAAAAMAQALDNSGLSLDQKLTMAGGMLHDVAKGSKRHEAEGGRLARNYGLDAVAPLIANHRDMDLPPQQPITESHLVFLADKFVRAVQVVPVEERYGERIRQWGSDPEIKSEIEGRLSRALTVRDRVQAAVDTDLYALLQEALA